MTKISKEASKKFQKIVMEGRITGVKALSEGFEEGDRKLFNPHHRDAPENAYPAWIKGWQWAFNDKD